MLGIFKITFFTSWIRKKHVNNHKSPFTLFLKIKCGPFWHTFQRKSNRKMMARVTWDIGTIAISQTGPSQLVLKPPSPSYLVEDIKKATLFLVDKQSFGALFNIILSWFFSKFQTNLQLLTDHIHKDFSVTELSVKKIPRIPWIFRFFLEFPPCRIRVIHKASLALRECPRWKPAKRREEDF